MAYQVIRLFSDKDDNGHIYHPGEIYPRFGLKASEKRIAELSTNDNAIGQPIIVEVAEVKEDKSNDDSTASKRNLKRFSNRTKR